VKPGEYADSYRFALAKDSVPSHWCETFYADLNPYLVLENKTSLIRFTKKQLESGKMIPYEYTHYGAHAARQMYLEQKRIPMKLKAPKDEDY